MTSRAVSFTRPISLHWILKEAGRQVFERTTNSKNSPFFTKITTKKYSSRNFPLL